MTNKPQYGNLFEFFMFTSTGRRWLRRNRLYTIVRTTLRAAIEQAKTEATYFIARYWAFDTGATSQEAVDYIKKRAFYDFDTKYGLFIGANKDYMQYILTMAERMRKRGKSVNWINKDTKTIEDDIIGKTVEYVNERLQINIKEQLINIGLGWMLGKGRMPRRIEVSGRQIKRYRGKRKPIKWLQ